MHLTIHKIRWSLIAGAVLLTAVLALYIGYGRYRALKTYRQILAHAGVSLTHDSNGVTWSQSMKNRKLYTIRAKKETSLGDGRYGLQDAELLLYTRSEDHPDRIYGSKMEYDQNAGILRAQGDVFMDLQAPQALAPGAHNMPSPAARMQQRTRQPSPEAVQQQVIHVRTSGLVYVRKLGIASTDQLVDLSYGGMQCRALGAEFNSDQSTVRLLANVHMDGVVHGQPFHMTARRAEMNRNEDVATISEPVATSQGRVASADGATLHLGKDGSIESVDAEGEVSLRSGTQQVTSKQARALLTDSSVVQRLTLSDGVILDDSDPMQPTHGSAHMVDAFFDAAGKPTTVTAMGGANVAMHDRRADPHGFLRSMQGDTIAARFIRSGKAYVVQSIHATGSAQALGESSGKTPQGTHSDKLTGGVPPKRTQVGADDLMVRFTTDESGRAQPEALHGIGHTKLEQDATLGEQEISTGDQLDMSFSEAPRRQGSLTVSSALQKGDVNILDRAPQKAGTSVPGALSTGTADAAMYDGSTQVITLSGDAHLYGNNASLIASTVTLNQSTLDVLATGNVQTTFTNAASDTRANRTGPSGSSTLDQEPVTHILSTSARFVHDTRLATFLGTETSPAFLWREGSQVKATTLFFDGFKHTFSASQNKSGELVQAIFASEPDAAKKTSSPQTANVFHIASPHMNYDDNTHEAVFSGGVSIHGIIGDVRGQQAVVMLQPKQSIAPANSSGASASALSLPSQSSPVGGSIDRVVVSGDVQLYQPDRHATCAELLYTAATQSYVLTGTPTVPPRVVDAQQGNVTGKVLLFTDRGSTIVVSGDSHAKGPGSRVRTQTSIGAGKERQ
jgi:lipopolysaccharide export system protein LptA